MSALLVAVTAAGAGLLFAASATTADGTDLRAGRRMRLTELITERSASLVRGERTAAQLRRSVEGATAVAAGRDARVATESARGDALATAAGLVAVVGDGLSVQLDDAPANRPGAITQGVGAQGAGAQGAGAEGAGAEAAGTPTVTQGAGTPPASPDDLVVHQQDVQAVVNALWAGGAEAMTLMGQRVISTSAVRCVGNTIILHGQVYGPPFVVTAIGDQQRMRDALDAEPGVELFRRYVARFALGYEVSRVQGVRLPAYDGLLDLPAVLR